MTIPIRSHPILTFSMIKANEIFDQGEKEHNNPTDFISSFMKSLSLPEAFISAEIDFFKFSEKHVQVISEEDFSFIVEQLIFMRLPDMYPDEWMRWVGLFNQRNFSNPVFDRIFLAIDQTKNWNVLTPFMESGLLVRHMLPHLIAKFSLDLEPLFQKFLIEQLAQKKDCVIAFLNAVLETTTFQGSFPVAWKLLTGLNNKPLMNNFANKLFKHLLLALSDDPVFKSWSVEHMLRIENSWRELETTFVLGKAPRPRLPKLNRNPVLTLSIQSRNIQKAIRSALSFSLQHSKEIPQKMKESIKNISGLSDLSIKPFQLEIDLRRQPELAYNWVETLLSCRLQVPLMTPFINGLARNMLYQLITNRIEPDINRTVYLLYNNLKYIPLPLYSMGLLETRGACELSLLLTQRDFEEEDFKTHFLQSIGLLAYGDLDHCNTQRERTLGSLALRDCIHKLMDSRILIQALRARSILSRYQYFYTQDQFKEIFRACQVEVTKLIIQDFSNQNLCGIYLDRFPELLDMVVPIALKFEEATDLKKNLLMFVSKAYHNKVKSYAQLENLSQLTALKKDVQTLVYLRRIAKSLGQPEDIDPLCAHWADQVYAISQKKVPIDSKEWTPLVRWMHSVFEDFFKENPKVSFRLQNIL